LQQGFTLEKKELRRFNDFLNSLGGRDKFSKLLQFTSKLLSYHLVVGQHVDLSKRFNDLAADLSQCRKGFRLFKSLNEADKFFEALESKKDLLLKMMKLAMAILYAVFWYYDAKAYLAKAKFLPNAVPSALNITAGRWWFAALIFQIFIEVVLIHRLYDKRRKEKDEDDDVTQTNMELFEKHLSMITLLGDFIVCVNQAQYDKALLGRPFHEGFVIASGFISSVIGVYQAYPNRK